MGKNKKINFMFQTPITIEVTINAPIEKVWEFWNEPKHIVNWAFASDTWEAPSADNDLKEGGKFKTVMAAKDGSSKFDFTGVYTLVKECQNVEYDMDKAPNEDKNRHVKIEFLKIDGGTKVVETFDPENENSLDMQKSGWQAILDNFKKYTESK